MAVEESPLLFIGRKVSQSDCARHLIVNIKHVPSTPNESTLTVSHPRKMPPQMYSNAATLHLSSTSRYIS